MVPHTSSLDVNDDGSMTYNLKGQPQTGEAGSARAAGYVVEQLNSAGAGWYVSDGAIVPPAARGGTLR